MSRINAIQKAIQSLDGGEYQKLMDAYLCKKFSFTNIQPLGAHTGTNKVTKGIPDSYVKLENGKYVLIMYGSVESISYEKIKNDIISCFNKDKIDIEKNKIDEIICCYTSTNIHLEQIEKLENMIEGMKITLLGIGTVSNDLLIHYPTIASEFLNISIDTQQIYDIDEFVRFYDKNGMNAPINMDLLHRETEIDSLMSKLEDNSIVLVYGKSGIGKTRLVLEVCKLYLQKYCIKVYCIKNNGLMLYDDLKYYLSDPGEYLLFIDDANQTTQLEHVLEYVINPPSDVKVKIILTVRDYAQTRVKKIICNKRIPQEFKVDILKDENIKDILMMNLEIKNENYLKQIIKIAKGNARLAVLAGKIAIEKGFLAIHNSTDIFRFYYENIMDKVFNNENKIIVGFVISLLGPIEFKLNKLAIALLSKYRIEENDFNLICHELNESEIVDLFMNQVTKISDQSMGNYLLYYVLIEKKYITIAEILQNGFKAYKNKIIYALNTLTNLFYTESCIEYIKDQVNMVWSTIDNNEDQLEYIESFHGLNEEKSLAFLKKEIDTLEIENTDLQKFDFENKMNNHTIKSKYINILGKFKYSKNYKMVLELLLYYFKKRPSDVMDFYFVFTDMLGYDSYSYQLGFEKEKMNLEYLWNQSHDGKDINSTILLLYVIRNYIKYEYHITESDDGKSISYATISLLMCEGLKKIRKFIWNILGELYVNELYLDFIDSILVNFRPYQQNKGDYKAIFIFDLSCIKNSIIKPIGIPSIIQCKILKHFEILCKTLQIDEDSVLKNYNLNKDFLIYQILIYDHEPGEDWRKEEENRKAKIYKLVENYNQDNFIKLFSVCNNIVKNVMEKNNWSLQTGISIVFNLIKENSNQYIMAIKAYLECDTPCYYTAIDQISTLIKYIGINETEKVIMSYEYTKKNNWIYDFICCIPEDLICIRHNKLFIGLINEEIEKYNPIVPEIEVLAKYQKFQYNIVYEFSNKLLDKFSSKPYIIEMFLGRFIDNEKIDKLLNLFKDDITVLENLYLAALSTHIDYNGKLFIELVKNNKEFLKRYIINIINDRDNHSHCYTIDNLWELDNYSELIDLSFDTIIEYLNGQYLCYSGLEEIFINTDKTSDLVKVRKIEWIKEYINLNFNDIKKIINIYELIIDHLNVDKKELILYLLSKNNNIDMFKKLPLFPSLMSWSGSEVPIIEGQINFLNELIDSLNRLEYIEHRAYLKEKAINKEKYKQHILIREYLEDIDLA